MRGQAKLRSGFESRLCRGLLVPGAGADPALRKLQVNVLFTGSENTLAALKTARELAGDLGAQIRLLVMQTVPYPLPLSSPLVPVAFTERRVQTLACTAAVDTRVDVYLCRERRQTLLEFLTPGSLLVIGGKKRRWQTSEQKLARWLAAKGYQVILTVPTEEGSIRQVF